MRIIVWRVKGRIMDDKFLFGVVLGMLGGALVATNSAKARQLVKNGQEQVKEKMNEVSKPSNKKSQE